VVVLCILVKKLLLFAAVCFVLHLSLVKHLFFVLITKACDFLFVSGFLIFCRYWTPDTFIRKSPLPNYEKINCETVLFTQIVKQKFSKHLITFVTTYAFLSSQLFKFSIQTWRFLNIWFLYYNYRFHELAITTFNCFFFSNLHIFDKLVFSKYWRFSYFLTFCCFYQFYCNNNFISISSWIYAKFEHIRNASLLAQIVNTRKKLNF